MEDEPPQPDRSPLHISTLKDLRRHERAILERVHSLPNGGRLLLLDPQRCLRDLGVTLSEDAQREWEAAVGVSLTRRTGLEAAYEGVARNTEPSAIRLKFKGLLPRGKE